MNSLDKRVKSCIDSVGLKGVNVDFLHYLSKDIQSDGINTDLIYEYTVGIPECNFIVRGLWNNYQVNDKIEKLNELFDQRIKFCKVRMMYFETSPIYQKTTTYLLVKFPERKTNDKSN